MRIVIEIDGEQVTASSFKQSGARATPPPELAQAAAVLGAISAGPAPMKAGASMQVGSLAPGELEAIASAAMDAGSAPARQARSSAASEKPDRPEGRSSARPRSTRARTRKR